MPQHLLLDVQKVIVMSLICELCHYLVEGDIVNKIKWEVNCALQMKTVC